MPLTARDIFARGSMVDLSVNRGYTNIVWNDTLKNAEEIVIDQPGLYHVTMVDKRGCVVSDTVEIKEVMGAGIYPWQRYYHAGYR